MKDETVLAICGMGCLTIVGVACIMKGINHTLIFSVAALIGGLAGYELKARRSRKTKQRKKHEQT